MKQLLIGSLAMVAVATPLAASAVIIFGVGNVSCGQWTNLRKSNDHLQLQAWAQGYLRGVYDGERLQRDPLKPVDAAAIDGWLDKYCYDHPLDAIYTAAGVLARELQTRSGQ